jgi:hypothetical protein
LKIVLAWWLWERTAVSLRWVGQMLAMGALYQGDAGSEPHEPETGNEVGETETTPFKNRKNRMNNQNCHFSRTATFTFMENARFSPRIAR